MFEGALSPDKQALSKLSTRVLLKVVGTEV